MPLAASTLRSLRRTGRGVALQIRFLQDFLRFKALAAQTGRGLPLKWEDRYPCLYDRTAGTLFDRHYVYHTAWAARVIKRNGAVKHVDIGSSLYFAGIVSAFVPVDHYDYRPANLELSSLKTGGADLSLLPFATDSIESLSCMHVVEHVGLGRYGEPLDPNADLTAARELRRVLRHGADLLFVVPVGRPRTVFNAHRIYSYEAVIEMFPGMELRSFALVPDEPSAGGLIEPADPHLADRQSYGCGCFWFRKLA